VLVVAICRAMSRAPSWIDRATLRAGLLGVQRGRATGALISRKEAAAQTGSEHPYGENMKLVRTAADWVFALPVEEQSSFVASMEALQQPVQLAAIAEIIERAPIVEPSSPAALASFAKVPRRGV
jgi:hypothetical protein